VVLFFFFLSVIHTVNTHTSRSSNENSVHKHDYMGTCGLIMVKKGYNLKEEITFEKYMLMHFFHKA